MGNATWQGSEAATDANARLIAAAPELLEALKPFAVYGRPGSRDVEVGAAITAIAKATGGAARALEGESIPWKLRKAAAELRQLHDQKIELLRARQVLGLECVKLQAQRDELLAALHHIEAIGMTKEDRVALREILQAARDAIAKATGGCSMNTDRAAAPDLLMFAQDVADGVIVPELMTHEGLIEVLLRWQKAARAAIAKATGGAPCL